MLNVKKIVLEFFQRHFFVRECVENLELTVPFVSTANNMADFFTKPLAAKQFFAMRDHIMNVAGQVSSAESSADVALDPTVSP